MPQATDELRDLWNDDGGVDDVIATRYLQERGFIFTRGGMIVASVDHEFNEKDFSAIDYMFHEWDYGYTHQLRHKDGVVINDGEPIKP